jgi:hypothetical protein
MTGLEQGNSGAAPSSGRIAASFRCWRAWFLLALLTTSAHAAAPSSNGQTSGDNVPASSSSSGSDATSSRAARDEAVRAIPWKSISPAGRQTAQSIINNTSIYRRLPTRIIDCDPDLFTFLLQHPEVVIDVWRVMGISQVALIKAPDGSYRGSDGAGTTGNVRYLFSNWGEGAHNTAVVYADGAYQGPPFGTALKAQTIMLMRSDSIRETNGRRYITVKVDTFVRIEQLGIEIIAKTVQPWIAKTADQNLIETLTFVSNFSRTAEKNPQGMKRLASRLNTLDEPTRNQLVNLCFRTAERYARRDNGTRTGSLDSQAVNLAVAVH